MKKRCTSRTNIRCILAGGYSASYHCFSHPVMLTSQADFRATHKKIRYFKLKKKDPIKGTVSVIILGSTEFFLMKCLKFNH